MADHPQYLRHKDNGGIYRWTEYLDIKWRIDGDMEPFDPETQDASEAPYSEISEDPRAGEPENPGSDPAGASGSGEPEVAPATERALKDLHWTAIKKMVEAKGGTYTNKAAAIAFLS